MICATYRPGTSDFLATQIATMQRMSEPTRKAQR
jgi:hypothetical protein